MAGLSGYRLPAKVPVEVTYNTDPVVGSTVGRFSFATPVQHCVVSNGTASSIYGKFNGGGTETVSGTDHQFCMPSALGTLDIAELFGCSVKDVSIYVAAGALPDGVRVWGTRV